MFHHGYSNMRYKTSVWFQLPRVILKQGFKTTRLKETVLVSFNIFYSQQHDGKIVIHSLPDSFLK